MRNYATSISALLVCLPNLIFSQKIDFLQTDFATAQAIATRSEKLILAKFSAKWCLPCRVMDEHVWTDPTLAAEVSESCVAADFDIETLDGLAAKQQFEVNSLPVVLILDACGRQLVRFEAACSTAPILERLRFLNTPANRFCPGEVVAIPADAQNFGLAPAAEPDFFVATPPRSEPKFFLSQPARREVLKIEKTAGLDLPQH